jgi:hypothetical protein
MDHIHVSQTDDTELLTGGITRAKLTAAVEKWRSLTPMTEFHPIYLPNGGTLKTISGKCGNCATEFEPELLRLRIDRPLPNVVVISGWGACHACQLLNPYNMRIRSEGKNTQMEMEDPNLGWVSHAFVRGRWGSIRYHLGRALGLVRKGPFAGFRKALKSSDAEAARDILNSGWTDAIEAELAGHGVRGLRTAVGLDNWTIVLDADGGHKVRLSLAGGVTGPHKQSLGPIEFEILS